MLDDTPDYASYSREELTDVERRINREKYPERYRLIVEEIARREQAPQPVPKPVPAWHHTVRRWYFRFFVAVWCGCAMGAVTHIGLHQIAQPKPTATHTQAIPNVAGGAPDVYVTPEMKSVYNFFMLFWIVGMPAVLVLGLLLPALGIPLNEPKTKADAANPASAS